MLHLRTRLQNPQRGFKPLIASLIHLCVRRKISGKDSRARLNPRARDANSRAARDTARRLPTLGRPGARNQVRPQCPPRWMSQLRPAAPDSATRLAGPATLSQAEQIGVQPFPPGLRCELRLRLKRLQVFIKESLGAHSARPPRARPRAPVRTGRSTPQREPSYAMDAASPGGGSGSYRSGVRLRTKRCDHSSTNTPLDNGAQP